MEINRLNDAIEAFRQSLRINPKDASAWHFLGDAYFFSGNRNAALDAVQKLRNIDPVQADELFNRIVPR